MGRVFLRPSTGRWSIVYDLPREPDGKRRRRVVGGFRSPLAARAELARIADERTDDQARRHAVPTTPPDDRLAVFHAAVFAARRLGAGVDMGVTLAWLLWHLAPDTTEQARTVMHAVLGGEVAA